MIADAHRKGPALFLIFMAFGIFAPASAGTLANGMMLDEPPAAQGWTAAVGKDGVVLTKKFTGKRAGDAPGGALIRFLQPGAPNGDLTAAFNTQIAGVPELAKDSPLWQEHGVTLAGDTIAVKEWCCAYRGDFGLSQAVVGIEGRGRRAFATLTRINLDDDAKAEADAAFQAMVRSWRMAPGDAALGAALVPPKGGGGLSGLYTKFASGLRPNGFGGMAFYTENSVTYFGSDGLFSTEIPPQGQQLGAFCGQKPLACGTYALSGGGFFSKPNRIVMMQLSNPYGIFSQREDDLAASGGDLRIGKDTWKHVEPLASGTRLSGTWTYDYAAGGSNAGQSGAVAVQRSISLTSDGRFTSEGWGGASVSNDNSGVTSSKTAPPASGSYEIAGYNISLKSGDGGTKMLSLFEPDASDDVLTINGADYKKE